MAVPCRAARRFLLRTGAALPSSSTKLPNLVATVACKPPVLLRRPGSPAAASLSSRSTTSSSKTKTSESDASKEKTLTAKPRPKASVYVHPLSQIVLLYLQTECHDWVTDQRLDGSLTIQRDGTFVLEFPDGASRVWTYYDPSDKKHWLSYGSGQIQHRFLLQDNLLSAWNGIGRRRSLPERIHESVNDLIQAIEEID